MKHLITLLAIFFLQSCSFTLVTSNREKVLIENIDIDQSIIVSEREFAQKKTGRSLGFWAMRDQVINTKQAKRINASYKKHISFVYKEFDIWHMTWAITNFYRNGNDEVKAILAESYRDAVKRGVSLDRRSTTLHVSGDKVYMGWFHFGGWAAAKKHLVVPGNKKFRQNSN